MGSSSAQSEISTEQKYVDHAYQRLDHLRAQAEKQLAATIGEATSETDQGVRERQHHAERLARRVGGFTAAESHLVIGRLDTDDGDPLYLGRIGIADDDQEPILIDWRAPAAAAFYRATPAERLGIRRRRHLQLRDRSVIGIDDDVLDFDALDGADGAGRGDGAEGAGGADIVDGDHLIGEAALLNTLRQARTGRMTDIVATIQAEQDAIIRSGLPGILVVEGGPGTGKTVVALHRAAYLLYTHRERLADKGVLVIGPNRTFLRYVERVLPGLGETDVVLSSIGDLYPPLQAVATDLPDTAMIKGDARMADLLAATVADHQRVPDSDLTIVVGEDEHRLQVGHCRDVRDAARERAELLQLPHNRVRPFVVDSLLEILVDNELDRLQQLVDEVEVPELAEDEEDVDLRTLLDPDGLRAALAGAAGFAEAVDRIWPELTGERVLADLYTDPALRSRVAAELSDREQEALARPDRATDWTVSDVPLLDELAELLGPTQHHLEQGERARRQAEAARSAEAEELDRAAEEAAELALEYADEDHGEIRIEGAEVLSRYYDAGALEPLADRARRDREWAYGHVIVDEAQELSPMAWRMLARRCPSGSMTAVGDLAQAAAPDSPRSWSAALDTIAAGRWRRAALTVSYRSTAPIMEVAGRILAAGGSDAVVPRAARADGDDPWTHPTTPDRLAEELPDLLTAERGRIGDGVVAVITTGRRVRACLDLVRTVCPEAAGFAEVSLLEAPVVVLTPEQAKGLEFDAVIIVAPEEIAAVDRHGVADLYVAATRPTRRLGLVPLAPFEV